MNGWKLFFLLCRSNYRTTPKELCDNRILLNFTVLLNYRFVKPSSKSFNPNEGHGVRPGSRVGKLMAEFGGKDDWCSVTILRHKMATIIQVDEGQGERMFGDRLIQHS